jgi:multiple sugar transport system permease protein
VAARSAAPPVAARRRVSRRVLVENLQGWLFAGPWLIGLFALFIGPMLWSIYLSLSTYSMSGSPRFVGLANYSELLADPRIWQSLKVTTVFSLMSVPLNLIVGLALAVLLNQKVRGVAVWRTIYYLPAVISGVGVALLWQWLLNGRFGLLNYALYELFDITGPNWLADQSTALYAFVIISLWTVGGSMLVNLSALQGVPTQLYEAASIDGANGWDKVRHITVPSISPVIFYNLIMGLIAALQSFTFFYILTKGGPNDTTLTYMLYLYNQAFESARMGYGSAMAWVLFVYLGLLTVIIFRWSSRWVHYEAAAR